VGKGQGAGKAKDEMGHGVYGDCGTTRRVLIDLNDKKELIIGKTKKAFYTGDMLIRSSVNRMVMRRRGRSAFSLTGRGVDVVAYLRHNVSS
jgi:hypothetical protein